MTAARRFLLIFLTSLAAARAGEPEDYKDLFPPLPPVREAENGWLLVKRLSPKVVRPQSKGLDLMIMPGEKMSGGPVGVNRNLLKEYVADNGPTIAVARDILKCQAWQRVRRSDGNPDFVFSNDNTSWIIFPCRVILAEAIVKAESGTPDRAWSDIIAVTRLGRRINQSGGPLIDTLTGSTLLVAGARAAAWAGQFAPDAATARRMADELRASEDPGDSFQRTLSGESYYILQNFTTLSKGGEPLKRMMVEMHLFSDSMRHIQLHFDKSLGGKVFGADTPVPQIKIPEYPYKENLAKWMKDPPATVLEQIETARTTDWSKYTEAVVETYRRARLTEPTTWADYQKAHVREKGSVSESGEPVEQAEGSERFLYQTVISNTARVRLASVSLLIKAWQLRHGGELPDSLELLVPDYLTSVPVDPFDGKAMRYDKLRRKLWCVGANLKDDAAADDAETDVIQPLSK